MGDAALDTATVVAPTQHFPPTPPSEAAAPTSASATSKMTSNSSAIATDPTQQHPQETKHIWVITGPAGCGKTSVAEHLHETYELPYLEGDSYHTPENVEKMRTGQPLTDADRWDWLILLREEALSTLLHPPTTTDPTSSPANGVIVTCSALKRKYRDVLRIASYHHPRVRVHFVFLQASEALLLDRVRARKGHYMKDYMVRSQFQSLETPQTDEGDVLSVDAGGTSEEVRVLAGQVVGDVMSQDD